MQYLGSVSAGASADSAFEYLLKQWLLTGRTDTKARDLCALSFFFSFHPTDSVQTSDLWTQSSITSPT
jgi:hypothetical protein